MNIQRHTAFFATSILWLPVAMMLFAPCGLHAETVDANAGATASVHTARTVWGEQPDIRVAYGSAMPMTGGGQTLSLPLDGRVLALLVNPGEAVRAGQQLLRFQPSANAASAQAQAESALALAEAQRSHSAELLHQQLATRDQLAQTDKAVSDARATLAALRREGGAATIAISAPFDGVVAAIPVAQGDRTAPGAALMVLTRADGLAASVGIEPTDRLRVQAGQTASIHLLRDGTELQSRVLRVDRMLNPRTRLVDTDLLLPAGAVLAGEALQAKIVVGQLRGWLVPHSAVLSDGQDAWLFQIEGNAAHRMPVKIVGTSGDVDVVEGPLDPSLRIVAEGASQLEDGMAVHDTGPAPPAAGAQP